MQFYALVFHGSKLRNHKLWQYLFWKVKMFTLGIQGFKCTISQDLLLRSRIDEHRNSQRSACLCIPNTEIKGLCHHAWLYVSYKRPDRRKMFLECLLVPGGFTVSTTKPRHCSLSLVRIYRRLFLELWDWRETKLQNFEKYLWGSWLLSPTESRNCVCPELWMVWHSIMVRTGKGCTVISMVVVIVVLVLVVIGTTGMGGARVLSFSCINLTQVSHRRKKPQKWKWVLKCVSNWGSVWILNGSLLQNWGYKRFPGCTKTPYSPSLWRWGKKHDAVLTGCPW